MHSNAQFTIPRGLIIDQVSDTGVQAELLAGSCSLAQAAFASVDSGCGYRLLVNTEAGRVVTVKLMSGSRSLAAGGFTTSSPRLVV